MTIDYDLLLQWASERSEGSLAAFRQAYEWLARAETEKNHWTWALDSLQVLGHLEVDWSGRRWEVSPPTIATVAGGGGYAILCGSRPAWFLRRLEHLEDDPDLAPLASSIILECPVPQDRSPSLRLVTIDEEEEAAEVCAGLGVRYSPFAADQLLHVLPRLSLLIQAGKRPDRDLPGGVFPTRMGMGEVGRMLFEEMCNPEEKTPGAYRIALFDTQRYFFIHNDGQVFESGRGEVVYMELLRRGQRVLRWDEASQTLLVPSRFRLPQLYERAVVLRTGLLPIICRDELTRATYLGYRNIDRSFASLLGRRLHQPSEVVSDPPMVPQPARPVRTVANVRARAPQQRQESARYSARTL